ncbi:MAG: hypothetical protein IJ201_00140 [Solobacterium sp.]|nr:hypothetical protein [Solobacterium sp.]
MSEPKQNKRFRFPKRKPVSFRRFAVGMVSAVLIFSVLFTVGMLGVDTIKYTIEADEAIQRMENAIIVSERSARTISRNYEQEMKQKLLFAAYLYKNDPDILKQKNVNILPAGNPFAVYDNEGSILYKDEQFPNFSRARILKYIGEFRQGGDDTGYVTTDAYGIIGLNSKGSANKGFLKLSPILFSPQMRLMIDLRRKHAQNEDLSAKRSAACNSGSTVSDVVPSRLLQRQSAEHTPDVDLHRSTVRYSKDVSLACAA